MLVYVYDEETKEFLREEEAFIDPLETQIKGENVYLLPANATFEEPLDKVDGKAVIFDGSTWKLIDDNRGKFTIKDNSIEEITTLAPVEKILTDEEIDGLNNGTLIIVDNEVVEKPAPTKEETSEIRRQLYIAQVDPLMSEYNRKKMFGLFKAGEEAELLGKIESTVKEIKETNLYPDENNI